MKKSTHPLMQLLVLLAMSLGLLLIASVVSAPILIFGGGVSSVSAIRWSQTITQLLTFVVPVVLMTLIYYRGSERSYYRLEFGGRKWLYGLVGVVIMLLLVPINDWLTVWNDAWNLGRVGELLRSIQDQTEEILQQLMMGDTVGDLVANLVVVALVAAVCEEVFFRAGIQNLLQRWLSADGRRPWGAHAAVWITALVFSLGHGELFAFMPRFLMGATLGYLYLYSGSILTNVLAHFANNALVVVLYWLVARGVLDIDPEAPLRVGALLTTGGTLAAVALFVVTFNLRGRRNK